MRNVLLFFSFLLAICIERNVYAQYVPIALSSGYNADVVANGTSSALASTTNDVDGVNYCFHTLGYQPPGASSPTTYGLPANGTINSGATTTPGLVFQLPDLNPTSNTDNSLRLATVNSTDTLNFQTPQPAENIYLLVTSGSGTANMTGLILFTDNTTQAIASVTVPDWFGGTTYPTTISGFGRVNRNTNALENPAGNPRLYQIEIPVDLANQSKQIAGIKITKTNSGTSVLNVMGVSIEAAVPVSCPVPSGLNATSITTTSAVLNWTENGSATQWELKHGPAGFNVSTGGTAVLVNTTPSYPLGSLSSTTDYDFYVRSICGPSDTSAWSAVGPFSTLCVAPAVTGTTPASRCGDGTVGLAATVTAGANMAWYADETGGPVLSTGSPFTTPTLTETDTFWVAASAGSGAFVSDSLPTITSGTNGCSGGTMFDLTPSVDVSIDSFKAIANGSGSSIKVFYRTGTYVGNGTTASAWTLHATINISYTTGEVMIPLPTPIDMDANTTYGVYIAYNASYSDGTGPNQTYTNADLTLEAGYGLCSEFGGVNDPRVFNGTVYYSKGGGGCESVREPVVATVNPLPGVDLGNDTTICSGVTMTLDAGNPGASYSWSTNASTSSIAVTNPGTYSVEVTTPAGCINADTIEIAQAVNPVAALADSASICGYDTLTLNAGNSGSTYQWSTGATTQTINVSSGAIYDVTITSVDGCVLSEQIVITEFPNPVVDLGNDTAICIGDQISFDAGNPGFSFQWSSGDTTQVVQAFDSGVYQVVVTAPSGCMGSDSVRLNWRPAPYAEGFNFIPEFYENLGQIRFEMIDPVFVNYAEWDFGDGSPVLTAHVPMHIYETSGAYEVTLTVYNNCGRYSVSQIIDVNLTTGMVTPLNDKDLSVAIYPNPVRDVLRFRAETHALYLERINIYNVSGQLVQGVVVDGKAHQYELNVSGLASGTYTVQLLTSQGWVSRKLEILR